MRAPAKINLELAVGRPGEDGYHPLATVFQAVSLYDEVTADDAPAGSFSVRVEGPGARRVPTGDGNLAVRAARAVAQLAEAERVDGLGVRLTVDKRIPVAGGMAGGSADAAAAIVACDALWGLQLSRSEMLEVAAGLGADVPFALLGGTAVGSGRGDRLTRALCHGSWHWVLLVAAGELSTPAVFGELDRLREGRAVMEPQLAPALMKALRSGDAAALGAALTNDLQVAAVSLRPELDLVLEQARVVGAAGVTISGSGPTVAVLGEDEEHAGELALALADAPGVARVIQVRGPVPGCRLIDQAARFETV